MDNNKLPHGWWIMVGAAIGVVIWSIIFYLFL